MTARLPQIKLHADTQEDDVQPSGIPTDHARRTGRVKNQESFRVPNEWLRYMADVGIVDHLYHLHLVRDDEALKRKFHDVRFVCVGGTPARMEMIARNCIEALQIPIPEGVTLSDMCGPHARFVMYKAGPVLTVSHGMGIPSISIMLHEVFKLLEYAQARRDVQFFRIGTCGGLGLKPGSVVITNTVYDGLLRNFHEQHILGEVVQRSTTLDADLRQKLVDQSSMAMHAQYEFEVCVGNTLCTDDFYEGQARLDGAICEYNESARKRFLDKCYAAGVRNIEMESLCFAAYTNYLGVAAAVVCVTLLDRLKEDQIPAQSVVLLDEWQMRPQRLVIDYMKTQMSHMTPLDYLQLWSSNVTSAAAGSSTPVSVMPTTTTISEDHAAGLHDIRPRRDVHRLPRVAAAASPTFSPPPPGAVVTQSATTKSENLRRRSLSTFLSPASTGATEMHTRSASPMPVAPLKQLDNTRAAAALAQQQQSSFGGGGGGGGTDEAVTTTTTTGAQRGTVRELTTPDKADAPSSSSLSSFAVKKQRDA